MHTVIIGTTTLNPVENTKHVWQCVPPGFSTNRISGVCSELSDPAASQLHKYAAHRLVTVLILGKKRRFPEQHPITIVEYNIRLTLLPTSYSRI